MSNTLDTEKKTIVVTPDDAEQGRQLIEQYSVNNSEYPWQTVLSSSTCTVSVI